MNFWQSVGKTLAKNPISGFAVVCVGATAAFLGYMAYRMISVLESSSWCSNALKAERISVESKGGLTSCVDLLKTQLDAVATGFHIALSSFAFSLIVLIVVVVAGAKANFKLSKDGITGDVSRDPAAAAKHVVDGAREAAAEVVEEV